MMNFWRQDVTKNFTVKLNFVSGDSNVMIPIPEEVMEQLDWTIDTELYLRFRDREILVSTTNYSEDNVRDNVDNYYNEQTQDIGC
jgi:antitoxin component of MazEF toxin-antitoxin module